MICSAISGRIPYPTIMGMYIYKSTLINLFGLTGQNIIIYCTLVIVRCEFIKIKSNHHYIGQTMAYLWQRNRGCQIHIYFP
jgi:hypothetical protein